MVKNYSGKVDAKRKNFEKIKRHKKVFLFFLVERMKREFLGQPEKLKRRKVGKALQRIASTI